MPHRHNGIIPHRHNDIMTDTNMFYLQAGLVEILVKQFRVPILVTLLYIGLSISFHVWSLHVRWKNPLSYWWTDGLLALFCIQRLGKTIVISRIALHQKTAIDFTGFRVAKAG